jgi:single-strand DNA-binding protein
MIEGRLKLDQWDDKQTGQKRSKLGVTLEGFQFLDSRGEGGGGGQGYQSDAPAAGASSASASAPAANIPEDDDVPF